ncbi:ribonuclease HI family protein [Thermosulfuriphilus sp.]
MRPKPQELIIFSDGAAKGNPGEAGAGAIILDAATGAVLREIKAYLGHKTNNEAEYLALILALEEAARISAPKVTIKLDSELLVRQLKGDYRVKAPNLKPLYQRVLSYLRHFKAVDIMHVSRELNAVADRLANLAIKEKNSSG